MSEFMTQLQEGNVKSVTIDGERVRASLRKPMQIENLQASAISTDFPVGMTQQWSFVQWLLDHRNGAVVRTDNNQNLFLSIFMPLVPWLLIFAFIWFFVFRQLRKNAVNRPPSAVYIVPPPENK